MILQALNQYYERLSTEAGSIAPEGFEMKEIPFIIVIENDGKFVSVQDTRSGDGRQKRGRAFRVPQGVKKTSGIASNLLWDTPNYVLGYPKPDPDKDQNSLLQRATEQRQCFIDEIRKLFPKPESDEGINAVLKFYEQDESASVQKHPLWKDIEDSMASITFKLSEDDKLICQRSAVFDAVGNSKNSNTSEKRLCLVTGSMDSPERLHTAIKGVRKAQSSGANIVSFNLDAFRSFGKEQGFNAPVGKKAAFAYTTALNRMLARDSSQKIQVGDATTVFWAEKQSPLEDAFFNLFDTEPEKGEPKQNYKQFISLFRSPKSGAQVELDLNTKFYVLGLSPNAGRISVRFWYAGTVGDIAEHITRHFEDLELQPHPEWGKIGLCWLLRSTALLGKDDNIAPNLAGDTMRAILTGTPYPQTLLAAAVRRCRAEQNVPYTRAALIKAILTRETRYKNRKEKEVKMSLDVTNQNHGYLLGRLFAVLERSQERANPGLNATIRDRYYGAASGTPVAVFPVLMKLNKHHIAKLENKGEAINLEKQIGEIMEKLDAATAFPAHLNIADQGRFAVGYYHQRQNYYTKNENKGEVNNG